MTVGDGGPPKSPFLLRHPPLPCRRLPAESRGLPRRERHLNVILYDEDVGTDENENRVIFCVVARGPTLRIFLMKESYKTASRESGDSFSSTH